MISQHTRRFVRLAYLKSRDSCIVKRTVYESFCIIKKKGCICYECLPAGKGSRAGRTGQHRRGPYKSQEARKAGLVQYGPNRLEEAKKDSFFKRLMKQLSDPMIIVLIAAALSPASLQAYTNESFADVSYPLRSHYQRPSGHVSGEQGREMPSRL